MPSLAQSGIGSHGSVNLGIWARWLTLCGADAQPCALNYPVTPAVVSISQAGLASSGGWARLTLAVSAPS